MNLQKVTIETGRLLLQPVSMKYKEEIFREFQEPVTRYIYSKPADTIEETGGFIKTALLNLEKGTDLHMAVLHKNTGEFLGMVGAHELDKENIEVGLWIKQSAQGNKYGREAMTGLVGWAGKNLKFGYIRYPVVAENIASRKIPESLGGKVEKEYEKKMMNGRTYHMVEYWIKKIAKL